LVADVDDLKGINDRQGHAAGDQALRWVAGFLSHGLRSDDVCCRTGGDESC
jgi:diguanylate cyclase (GGDEF)-like protein